MQIQRSGPNWERVRSLATIGPEVYLCQRAEVMMKSWKSWKSWWNTCLSDFPGLISGGSKEWSRAGAHELPLHNPVHLLMLRKDLIPCPLGSLGQKHWKKRNLQLRMAHWTLHHRVFSKYLVKYFLWFFYKHPAIWPFATPKYLFCLFVCLLYLMILGAILGSVLRSFSWWYLVGHTMLWIES